MRDARIDALFRRYRDQADGAALAAVFDATSRELLDVACHLVRDAAEAEDLVQTTFLTAMRRAESFDGRSTLRAWLYGILWREGARARRGAARRADTRELEPGVAPDPLEDLERSEVPAAVREALAALPARDREVLEPLLLEGRRSEEIARRLRRPAGTVRSQVHRGLARLRRRLPSGLFAVAGVPHLPRGLEAVRAEVLAGAGASSTTLPAAGTALSLGALSMTKTTLVLSATAVAAGLGGLALLADPFGGPPRDSALAAEAPVLAPPVEEPVERLVPGSGAPTGGQATAEAGRQEAPAPAERDASRVDLAPWLARFAENPDDWRHGWAVAAEIARLPPDQALAVMRGVWPHLSVPVKEQALKPFVFHGGHPHALKVLDLAARDESFSVQGRAWTYLESYALCDFSTDHQAYLAWSERWSERPVAEVLEHSARALAGELLEASPTEIVARLEDVKIDPAVAREAGLDLAAVLREAGGLRAVESVLTTGDEQARAELLEWATNLEPDEAWLRQWVLPDLAGASATSLDAHLRLLGRPGNAWATGPIVDHLRRLAPLDGHGNAHAAASALAEIGDPSAVPALIGVLQDDPQGELGYWIGHFGLAELTGVKWKEDQDAAFWLAWWNENRHRFPPEVAALEPR